MSNVLKLHALGSFQRIHSTASKIEYHFAFTVKVTDSDGHPVLDLKEENFSLRLAGLEDESLGSLILTPSRDAKLFPGFYKLNLLEIVDLNVHPSFDFFLISGYLFSLAVNFHKKHGNTPVIAIPVSPASSQQ